jgi:DNA-binding winged helix-turn-helix (wHTH) protein
VRLTQNDPPRILENPFFHRGPIRHLAYFYNRKRQSKQALEMLGKGQSVSIVGPRKIGKTSLLFHISRPEVMQQYGLDPTRHLVVYFNCEGSGSLKPEEFYTLVLEEVAIRAAQYGYSLDSPEYPVSYLEFKRILRQVFDKKLQLTLLLDEFEVVDQNRHLGEEFLSGLRALATKFDAAYLTVSQRPLATFAKYRHSLFFNIFLQLKIGLFDELESRDLIEGALAGVEGIFPPDIVKGILELGGGHPFFLQVVGYWALELQATKGVPLEGEDLRILAQTVRGEVESHFAYYWRQLTPQEQYVLAALPLVRSEETYREQLETLTYLCLVVKEDGQYRCFSSLFRDFVRRQKVNDILQAGPFVLAPDHQRALLRERPLSLSARQFALLSYLVEHQGQVVSNEELDWRVLSTSAEEEQEYEYLGDERLKSAIKGLREALGDAADCIVNKRGVGYVFQLSTEE